MSRLAILAVVLASCSGAEAASEPEATEPEPRSQLTIVPASEVEWQPLNPARGDASPRAATLWGNRRGAGRTGFLVRFVDGFASPPHIHNVTYRGVVLEGRVHNDDPDAAEMWMPPGSFWTQPKGKVHITSSRGESMAYIEIDDGPYLVHPVDRAFDDDARPVNVDASNIVWVSATRLGWPSDVEPAPEVAFLWGGDPALDQPSGLMVKLPSSVVLKSRGSLFRAVVVRGRPTSDDTVLEPGSYLGSDGAAAIGCEAECVLYVQTRAELELLPVE